MNNSNGTNPNYDESIPFIIIFQLICVMLCIFYIIPTLMSWLVESQQREKE